MIFYIHHISPLDSAEHHDTCVEGYHYGIWEHKTPAPTPHIYRVQSKNMEAAEDSRKKLEKATEGFSSFDEWVAMFED